MKKLTFNGQHNVGKLYEALIAAHPDLAPVLDQSLLDGATGKLGAYRAAFFVGANESAVFLTVPDSVPDEVVAAAVASYDSTPDPVVVPPSKIDTGNDVAADQGDKLADAVDTLRAYLALSSPTNAQTIAAFKLLIRMFLFLLKQQGY